MSKLTEEQKKQRREELIAALRSMSVNGVAPSRYDSKTYKIYCKSKCVFSSWSELCLAAGLTPVSGVRSEYKPGDLRRALGYTDIFDMV